MNKSKFRVTEKDSEMLDLMEQTDKHTLAIWAKICTERVMPYFTASYPDDLRPQQALDSLQDWIDTEAFSMQVIRKASLNAHACARNITDDSPAKSVARSAGQAVATAHVYDHAIGAANYALQAIHRASSAEDADSAVANERVWQLKHLKELHNNHTKE